MILHRIDRQRVKGRGAMTSCCKGSGRWLACGMLALAAGLGLGAGHARSAAPPVTTAPGTPVEPGTAKIGVARRPYDIAAIAAAAVVPPAVHRGRTIWLQRCAFCHDGVGQPQYQTMGPWIGAETVTLLTPEAFKAFVQAGTDNMPGFQHVLDDRQMANLTAFIATRGPETKPTDAQMRGGAAAAKSTSGD